MALTDEAIREILAGKRILIVEDDPDLGPALQNLFRRYCGSKPDLRECMKGTIRSGGLNALKNADPPYDLAVVDVRLPKTKEQLDRVRELDAERIDVQRELMSQLEVAEEEESPELSKLRDDIDEIDRKIRSNIDQDAGLDMVRDWIKGMRSKKKKGPNWKPHTTILYLTARQRGEISELPYHDIVRSEYLVKPVMPKEVVEKAATLIRSEATAGGLGDAV